MKKLVGLLALSMFAMACASGAPEPETEAPAVVEEVTPAVPNTGGTDPWCPAKVDCINACDKLYPRDPTYASLCKKINNCGSKCETKAPL